MKQGKHPFENGEMGSVYAEGMDDELENEDPPPS